MAKATQSKPKTNGFEAEESPFVNSSNAELDTEREIIDSLKAREESNIITPDQFVQQSKEVAMVNKIGAKGHPFAFKAGRDPITGKRYFNNKGMANPAHVYRASKMVEGKKSYYFFAENHDKLMVQNSDRILTVNAWILDGKLWEQTPIAKAQLKDIKTVNIDEASRIYEQIKSQGKNPGI